MGMVRELLMHGHKDPFSEGYHFSGGPIPGLRLSVLLSILVVGWGGVLGTIIPGQSHYPRSGQEPNYRKTNLVHEGADNWLVEGSFSWAPAHHLPHPYRQQPKRASVPHPSGT